MTVGVGPIEPEHPVLLLWRAAFDAKGFGHFTHGIARDPGCWLGFWYGPRLLAAMGLTICHDHTLFIDELLCEPTRAGLHARVILGTTVRDTWSGAIRFNCEVANRSVRRVVELLGARPVAALYEATGGR